MGRCKVLVFFLLLLPKRMHLTMISRTSLSSAKSLFSADSALPITDFGSQLKSLLFMYSHIYVDLPPSHSSSSSRRNLKSIFKYFTSPARAEYDPILESISSPRRHPLAPELASLRAVKSAAEQKVMHAAATISGRAHAKVRSAFNVFVKDLKLMFFQDDALHTTRND